MISFAYPLLLALTVAVVPMLWLLRRRQSALGHSQVDMHKGLRSFSLVGWLPTVFFALAWVALVAALARPLLPETVEKRSIQTRDFIVVTDISGSMWTPIGDPAQQQFAGGQPGSTGPGSDTRRLQRIDVAQEAIKVFVEHRKGDRVALLVFDDDTYYHWPLTDDLKIIQRKSQLLNKRPGGGTNFEGPSDSYRGIGPLQAAIDHFKEMGRAKTKVLVLVTDGESTISPKRFEELAEEMEALGVRIYVLGVGESWVNGSSMTMDLRRFVERLNGTILPVGDAVQLRNGFDTIDKLEVSKVELEKQTSFKDIYHLFLAASVGLWLLYLLSAALVRENV